MYKTLETLPINLGLKEQTMTNQARACKTAALNLHEKYHFRSMVRAAQ